MVNCTLTKGIQHKILLHKNCIGFYIPTNILIFFFVPNNNFPIQTAVYVSVQILCRKNMNIKYLAQSIFVQFKYLSQIITVFGSISFWFGVYHLWKHLQSWDEMCLTRYATIHTHVLKRPSTDINIVVVYRVCTWHFCQYFLYFLCQQTFQIACL